MTIQGERRVLTSGHFKAMPKIVCLCGSTRFYQQFQRANYEETMAGNIVLSVGFYMHSSKAAHGETWGAKLCSAGGGFGSCRDARDPDLCANCEEWQNKKRDLDELHKRKIDLADEVFVLNVGGYIGESTRSEIDYAKSLKMPIRYLEPSPIEESK